MPEPHGFLLVHRTPDGEINSHPYPYQFHVNAALAANLVLQEAGIPADDTVPEKLEKFPLGALVVHPSGYRFRILEADFTSDGALIVPGLAVRLSDNSWGTVWPDQFMTFHEADPGGKFFDRWYWICHKDEDQPKVKYNGARMTATAVDR